MAAVQKTKILVISASPVENGHVEQMLGIFSEKAFSLGADIDIVRLVDNPPPTVTGKLESWDPDPFWAKKLEECDAIVIGTPTYWFGAPGILKNWIDNLTPLTYEGKLAGKLAGFIVYGPEGGASILVQWLGLVANNIGFTVPAYGLIWQEGPYKKANNTWVYKAIPALAENIIALVTALTSVPDDATPYLSDKIRRYRARGGKKPNGLGAFVEPMNEEGFEIEPEGPGETKDEPHPIRTKRQETGEIEPVSVASDTPTNTGS